MFGKHAVFLCSADHIFGSQDSWPGFRPFVWQPKESSIERTLSQTLTSVLISSAFAKKA